MKILEQTYVILKNNTSTCAVVSRR